MSVRRSTRSAARGSASPAPTQLITPGRRIRIDPYDLPALLPPISRQPSTAYGSTFTAPPTSPGEDDAGVHVNQTLSDVLTSGHNSQHETQKQPGGGSQVGRGLKDGNSNQSRRTAVAPPLKSTPGDMPRSFNDESGIFGDATILGTPVGNVNAVPLKTKTARPDPGMRSIREESSDLDEESNPSQAKIIGSKILNGLEYIAGTLSSLFSFSRVNWISLMLGLVIFSLLIASLGVGDQMVSESRTAVGRLFPGKQSKYEIFEDDNTNINININGVESRLRKVEIAVSELKNRPQLSAKDFKYLEKMLPDLMFLDVDKSGQKQIPLRFWKALKSKMQEDSPILKDYLIESGQVHPGPDGQLTEGHVRKIAKGTWAEFMNENDSRLKASQESGFEDSWNKHLKIATKEGFVVTKSEFTDAVTKFWEHSQASVKSEIERITSDIDRKIRSAGLAAPSTTLTEADVKAITKAMIEKLGERIRLEALAAARLRHASSESLGLPNHFSIGNGAVVDPYITSPTFQLRGMTTGSFLSRMLSSLMGSKLPEPNPPSTALRKWDEAGDCWCAPATGKGPVQLAVLMKHWIYPDQVVIEHIHPQATLDRDSAPIDFEVWGQVLDWPTQLKLGALSDEVFPDGADERHLDETFLRIGTFSFNPNDEDLRQVNPIQLDMRRIQAPTQKLVVRVLSNAGADHTCLYRVIVHGEVAR